MDGGKERMLSQTPTFILFWSSLEDTFPYPEKRVKGITLWSQEEEEEYLFLMNRSMSGKRRIVETAVGERTIARSQTPMTHSDMWFKWRWQERKDTQQQDEMGEDELIPFNIHFMWVSVILLQWLSSLHDIVFPFSVGGWSTLCDVISFPLYSSVTIVSVSLSLPGIKR